MMTFSEIAKFLNISEMIAKHLAKRGVLPGRPCKDGWQTTKNEIERWYISLSGKEWADLVSKGKVDSLTAQIKMEEEVLPDILFSKLKSWEEKKIIGIISYNINNSSNLKVMLMVFEADESAKKEIESLFKNISSNSVRRQIELTYKCENIIRDNPMILTFSKNKILKLTLRDTMSELPQREREIIRFFLTDFILRFSSEFKLQNKNPRP